MDTPQLRRQRCVLPAAAVAAAAALQPCLGEAEEAEAEVSCGELR